MTPPDLDCFLFWTEPVYLISAPTIFDAMRALRIVRVARWMNSRPPNLSKDSSNETWSGDWVFSSGLRTDVRSRAVEDG